MRRISEALETEFSLITDKLEAESDDILVNKADLAYQTFQKPHHSENDRFWGKLILPFDSNSNNSNNKSRLEAYGFKAMRPAQPRTAQPRARQKIEERKPNLFVIKSQTKTGAVTTANRIAKFHNIRAVNPFSAKEKPTAEKATQPKLQQEPERESELPSESQWIVSTRNLKRVSKEELELRLSRNSSKAQSEIVKVPQSDAVSSAHTDMKTPAASHPKTRFAKKPPQLPLKIRIGLKKDFVLPHMEVTGHAMPLRRPPQKIAFPKIFTPIRTPETLSNIPDSLSNFPDSPLIRNQDSQLSLRRRRPSPILNIKKFEAFFDTPKEKLANKITRSHDVFEGKILQSGRRVPIKIIQLPMQSLDFQQKSGQVLRPVLARNPTQRKIAVKADIERSSTDTRPESVSESQPPTGTPSTGGRKRSTSMSKGQSNVLNKIFNCAL